MIIVKLEAYYFDNITLKLFHSYFSDLNQVVKTRSAISKWIDIFTGISQGSTLGPLIFNIFINDLIMFFEKMTLAIIRMIILAQNYSKPSVVLNSKNLSVKIM